MAAIVAVLGLSASSQAGLLAEIAELGTNLLTVAERSEHLRRDRRTAAAAPAMIARMARCTRSQQHRARSTSVTVYRNPLIPPSTPTPLPVQAASLGLLPAVGTSVARGSYLNAATAHEPVAVLGATAAQRLGIDRISPASGSGSAGSGSTVAGILNPAVLAPEIDTSVLVGFPAAQRYLGFDGHPSTIYVRAHGQVTACTRCSPRRPTRRIPAR